MIEPKLYFFHGYLIFGLAPVLLFWRWSALLIALLFVLIFWLFERKGYEPVSALRAVRAYFIGSVRPAIGANRREYWKR